MNNLRKSLPILGVVALLLGLFLWVDNLKNARSVDIGTFSKQKSCAKLPKFLSKLHIPQPIMIDLSQGSYRGIAFRFGRGLSRVLYLRKWGKFDHLGTYAIDPEGNIYLTPMPFISVKPKTFEFQSNIYRLDSQTKQLSIWKRLEEVNATLQNPFGIISIDYDCDDKSLWVSSLDGSEYNRAKGRIYHIDIATKRVLERVEGVDALSIKLIHTSQGKYLLAGLANLNFLYAYKIVNSEIDPDPIKLFELPDANEHIRSIKIIGDNKIKIQTIPFLYTLVAQTVEGNLRKEYIVTWDSKLLIWRISYK